MQGEGHSLKACSKCKAEKPIDEFYLRALRGAPRRTPQCKDCMRAYSAAHQRKRRTRSEVKAKEAEYSRVYHQRPEYKEKDAARHRARTADPEVKKARSDSAEFKLNAADRTRKYRSNPEARARTIAYANEYRRRPSVQERRRELMASRYKNDPSHRVERNVRRSVLHGVRMSGKPKSGKTTSIIGCSFAALRDHLESQFTEGMSWENYGLHGWHIDHIIPVSSFNLADESQMRQCFHWSNMQPLWSKDNRRKLDRMPDGTPGRRRRIAFSNIAKG